MPQARRDRRTLLLLTACVATAASTGCLRSSPVRLSSGDVPAAAPAQPASTPPAALNLPAELLHDNSINRTSAQPATAPLGGPAYSQPLSPPPPPALNPATPDPHTSIPDANSPPSGPPATPLLDAAIKRVEAIQEIQRQSLLSEQADAEADTKATTPPPVLAVPTPRPAPALTQPEPAANTDLVPAPPMPPLSANSSPRGAAPATASPAAAPTEAPPAATTPFFPLPDLAACLATETPAPLAAIITREARNRGDGPDPDHPAQNQFRIAEFQLCRHISGFGSFDRVPENTLQLGQQILIYGEITGLRYEPTGDAFMSKISSRIELRTQNGDKIVWAEDLGSAEECCRRVRRDYYVSACIEFPKTLEPGPYHLRLIQTDQVGHQTTSADLPVTIRP